MSKVYLAGHMLNKGSQLLRAMEAAEVEELGHEIFNPMNAEHNDKQNTDQTGLAERILANDTTAINWSDTVVIEPDSAALGTHVELGQVLGMRDVASEVIRAIETGSYYGAPPEDIVKEVYDVCKRHTKRKVYPHLEDIRRTDIPETGDRRSFSVNQYVYGACLKLTDGKGFYEWEEIVAALSEEE